MLMLLGAGTAHAQGSDFPVVTPTGDIIPSWPGRALCLDPAALQGGVVAVAKLDIRACIFDMDDLLVQSGPLWRVAETALLLARKALERLGGA